MSEIETKLKEDLYARTPNTGSSIQQPELANASASAPAATTTSTKVAVKKKPKVVASPSSNVQ